MVVASQIINTAHKMNVRCLSWKRQRCLSSKSHIDMGTNDQHFIFLMVVVVLNVLDETRSIYCHKIYQYCHLYFELLFIVYVPGFVNCFRPVTSLLMFTMHC